MNTWIADNAVIRGDTEIADGCSVYFHAVIRTETGKIRIGSDTNIQDGSIIHADSSFPVTIGEGVTIGHGCIIHGCTVGDNTVIGMGSVIMNGAVIGADCIIGAGSLITEHKVIPDGSVAFGSPAKIIRKVSEEEVRANRQTAEHYLEIQKLYITQR